MSSRRVVVGAFLLLAYAGTAGFLVWGSYRLLPPTNFDSYKEFGIRASIALTAAGGFFGAVLGLFTLSAQLQAARETEATRAEFAAQLENHKAAILKDLEARKAELQKEIEQLKGAVSRQNEFLMRTLDVKSIAYDKLFVASNNCYRELQNLTKGRYDRERALECERSLREAEGLAANLDNEDRAIVQEVVQCVLDINDLAEQTTITAGLTTEMMAQRYERIWAERVKDFGAKIERLRNRSLYHNKSTNPGPPV